MNYKVCTILAVAVFVGQISSIHGGLFGLFGGGKTPEQIQAELDEVTDRLANIDETNSTSFGKIESDMAKVATLSRQLNKTADMVFYYWINGCQMDMTESDWVQNGYVNFTAISHFENGRDVGKHLQPYLDHCARKSLKTFGFLVEKWFNKRINRLTDEQRSDLEKLDSLFVPSDRKEALKQIKDSKLWIETREDVTNALPKLFDDREADELDPAYQVMKFDGATEEQLKQLNHINRACDVLVSSTKRFAMTYFVLLRHSAIDDLRSKMAAKWVPTTVLCWQLRVPFGGKSIEQAREEIREEAINYSDEEEEEEK